MEGKNKLYEEIMKGVEDEIKRVVEIGMKKAKDKKLRLAEMEIVVRDMLQNIGGKVLKELMEFSGTGYEGTKRICTCGKFQEFKDNRAKQVSTLGGNFF